jgi:hypothetical protein
MKKLYFDGRIEHKDRIFLVDGVADVTTDRNFGADADGNRGVSMDFVEDVKINSIHEIIYNEDEATTKEINYNDLPADVQEYIEEYIGECGEEG